MTHLFNMTHLSTYLSSPLKEEQLTQVLPGQVREHEIKAVVNKDLSKRVRTADVTNTAASVVETSVSCCKQLIERLDRRGGLYMAEGEVNPVLEDIHLEPSRVLDR